MHLHPQPRKKNGKAYMYYSIAESYRIKGNSNPKTRILFRIGKLTPHQVQQIRNILKVIKSPDAIVARFEDIIYKDHWRYLDVAFVSYLWDRWDLSKLFPTSDKTSDPNGKDISTSKIAKMLTIYRCLDPDSYLSAVNWFKSTTLDLILKADKSHINKSRIFRELTEIEKCKGQIEKYLYELSKKRNKKGVMIVFYDLTDSYFHGRKCELAISGRTKSNGFRSKKIVLALLVDSEGYPFGWDILGDYTSDVGTIKGLVNKLEKKFKIEDYSILLVFDRGMVSDENLKLLEKEKQFYITALDKDQIPTLNDKCLFSMAAEYEQYLKEGSVNDVLRKIFEENGLSLSGNAMISQGDDKNWTIQDDKDTYAIKLENGQLNICPSIDFERFASLDENNAIEEIRKRGFKEQDDKTYHKELGWIDGRRYVLVFNPEMFANDRKHREEDIQKGLDYLKEENKLLDKAERSRNRETTEQKIGKKLKDMNARKFIDYDLEPNVVEHKGKDINTFKIIPKETEETENAKKKAKKTDGLWVIITNVLEKERDKEGLTAEELIDTYRNKNRVEEAFRDVKSFIDVQPFNVWTTEHVKAHYAICVLSYLLDVTVTNKIRKHKIEGIGSVHKAYEKLEKYNIADIEMEGTEHAGKKMLDPRTMPKNIVELLKLFKCDYLISNEHLESIKVGK